MFLLSIVRSLSRSCRRCSASRYERSVPEFFSVTVAALIEALISLMTSAVSPLATILSDPALIPSLKDTVSATECLKEAERIIDRSVGSSNIYMKSVYYYLFTAYTLSRDHEHALEYQKKYKDLNRTLKLSDKSMNK